jgi:hypothetical protein
VRAAAWDELAVVEPALTLRAGGSPPALVPAAPSSLAPQRTVSLRSRAPPPRVRELATLD